MVDAIGSQGGVGTASLAQAVGGNDSLGKEAFLKLLVEQIKHQDPLQPKENSEFVAELAQFSSLEQTMGINERLDMLSLQNQGLANSQVASFVGQRAVVRGDVTTLDASGQPAKLAFKLSDPAETVSVSITNAEGEVVRKLELGKSESTVRNTVWDGMNDEGVRQPPGRYTFTVNARGKDEEVITYSPEATGVVESVSFNKGYPELSLDSGIAVPVSDLIRVESSPVNP
jgi:flagellar basal-body rod modification protein FlgD